MNARFSDNNVNMLVGTTPGQKHFKITCSKLRSNKQVLLCLLANLKDLHWKQALSTVIDNVLSHYRKANIPMFIGRNNVGRVIKTYYDKYTKLMKLTKKTEMLKMQ